MELILMLDTKEYKDFIKWLIRHIKRNWVYYIKPQQLIPINTYLNSDKCNIKWLGKKRRPINIINLIDICFNNLTYTLYPKKAVIHFNKVDYLPFTFTKIYDIASLINYGNLDIGATNTFTNIFKEYDKSIVKLFETYLREQM